MAFYREAISNGGTGATSLARTNAVRSGYFARNRVVVSLNGAQRAGTIKASLRIDERLGSEPSTADLQMKGGAGYVPDRGHAVIIGHGTVDNVIFGGRVLRAERYVTRHVEKRPTYTLEMADHGAFDLRTMLGAGYRATSTSANSILAAVISATTPSVQSMGLTTTYVEAGLPVLSVFDVTIAETLADTFDRLADTLGASWYYDYRRRLHFWVTADPQPRPTISTLSGTSPGFWDLTRAVDLTQCISRVVGLGAATETAADVYSTDRAIPIVAAEAITDDNKITYRGSRTGMVLVDGVPRSLVKVLDDVQLDFSERIWQASPFSLNSAANLWVAGLATTNVDGNGQTIMLDRRWWADGAYSWHVQSVNQAVSITANTIYSHFWVPSSGPGAPPPTMIGALEDGHPLSAPDYYEMQVATLTGTTAYVVPKGTPVRAYYTAVNSTAYAQIQTLCGHTAYGWVSDVVEGDYTPQDLIEACEARLTEGAPDNWQTLTFSTRNVAVQRGQRVYVSLTSPGESGGPTIAGSFTVQEMTLAGFDETGDAIGPVRQVTAQPVRRPNLWRVLRLQRGASTERKK